MVTIATGQSRHHVVSPVVKVLKYGHESAITLLQNMAETAVAGERLKKFDFVRWNHAQVSSAKCVGFLFRWNKQKNIVLIF